jgi:hypothetical protein
MNDYQIQPGCTDTATLRDLLREVVPKCDQCEKIATWYSEDWDSEYYMCDQHLYDNGCSTSIPYDLGRRIKVALEE